MVGDDENKIGNSKTRQDNTKQDKTNLARKGEK